MFPVELPNASGMRPLHFTILTIAMAILALVYITYIGARWSGYWQSDLVWVDSPVTRTIRVAGTTFRVPSAYLPAHGKGFSLISAHETASNLSLEAAWPQMKPYRTAIQAGSSAEDRKANLILINIALSLDEETMRDRLDPVYRRLARGEATKGPAGLKILTLSSPVALEKDQIVFEPQRSDGFIARCRQTKSQAPLCTRELRVSKELVLTYRFDRSLLANWGRLDRKVLQLTNSLQP